MLLRKSQPGSDSFGHMWRTAKSVVEVTDEEGAALLAIPDGGFTVVETADDQSDEGDDGKDVTEPAPTRDAAADATSPKKTTGRRRTATDE